MLQQHRIPSEQPTEELPIIGPDLARRWDGTGRLLGTLGTTESDWTQRPPWWMRLFWKLVLR